MSSTTPVTAENFCLAESQIIMAEYVKKIAAANGTSSGVGAFMHLRQGPDPKDRTIVRVNFDTIYSMAVLDLATPATLVMPETNGRYQSAHIITEEHYNPFTHSEPGTYTLSQENVGGRYACVLMRTQCNMKDPKDLAVAHALQDQLVLTQSDPGSYVPSHSWDMAEVLAMRATYQALIKEKGYTSEQMFGKKGEVPLEVHNAGAAYGWGGLTKEQAVYPAYEPTSSAPQTLRLKDVPMKAFWSITVYAQDGFPKADGVCNINSAWATPDEDGAVTVHFGGDEAAPNRVDIFEGWNFVLRLYVPTEPYFSGAWTRPELQAA